MLPAVPDPGAVDLANLDALPVQVKEWLTTDPPIADVLEILDRTNALSKYFRSKRMTNRPTEVAERWLEVRVGVDLGEPEPGKGGGPKNLLT